jgi:hypothetical protein
MRRRKYLLAPTSSLSLISSPINLHSYSSIEFTVNAISFLGFGVDDHRIRGLMRFIKMTSRESWTEDVEQVRGAPILKGAQS